MNHTHQAQARSLAAKDGTQPLQRIGILAHPLRPGAGQVSEQVEAFLRACGLNVWRHTTWESETVTPLVADSDLVIAIGGDGAMLRAARLCAPADVPVFGINTGHLGFLTESSGADESWKAAIKQLLAGNFWIEQRMMITSEAWHGGQLLCRGDALNDVVISRGTVARSVFLELYIDGGWTTTYHADGLIIATPTGATAYALAVGGPILPPELKNILVSPIAPHLSMDRSMVLAEGAAVEVIITPDTTIDVVLTVDGENTAILSAGDRVLVRASEQHSHFVRLRERNYFYRSLLDRMEPRIGGQHTHEDHPYITDKG
ncbi:MAG: NAD(+)/NADH kinase [Aggregatilineales bacterium]